MKKNALNTSLRSATHTTDSTRSGWIANTATTKALRHRHPVIRRSTMNSRITVAVCSRTLVR